MPRPTTYDGIKQAIVEEWDNLKVEDYEDMILSMPERVAACLAAEGGHTRWHIFRKCQNGCQIASLTDLKSFISNQGVWKAFPTN
jgi:hypothetical protein